MAKDTPTPPASDPATQPDLAPVEVRVLTACTYGNANDLAILPASHVAAARADGLVDDNPAAVAYAKSLASDAAAPAA